MKKLGKVFKKILKGVSYVFIFIFLAYTLCVFLIRPSNNRNWNNDQKVLPFAYIGKDIISVNNVRDFTYASTTSFQEGYYSESFLRGSVKRVWYVVEPFSGPGAAHTFLSFEFEDGRYLPISIEIRKEKGETFDPMKGLFRQYEIMYVAGDENDIIKLRTNYRNDKVYLYPIRATKQQANTIFEDMLTRANDLTDNPEFYNTLTNTCTTNIVDHINKMYHNTIPFSFSELFPASSDYYAYKLGLIDTDLPMEKIRDRYNINDLAKKYANDTNFSKRIRGM